MNDPKIGSPGSGPALRATLLRGGASLGAASMLQRVLGFLASFLAARIGGPFVFGAYSLGLSTAGMVASYVGLGIGTTATRYIAQAPRDGRGYRTAIRRVAVIGGACSVAAALILFFGAPLAARTVFRDAGLIPLLQAAAASAFALIMLDAMSGVAIGLLNFRMMLWLSGVAGVGMVAALAAGARHGAPAMLLGQAVATALAVVAAVAINLETLRPLPFRQGADEALPPARDFLLFGLAQLGATVAVSLASWWVAVLVARSDSGLAQMGYYGVGNQFRAMVTMAPTQLSALVIPLLARFSARRDDQDRVVSSSTFLCSVSAAGIGTVTLLFLPLLIQFYGFAFEDALTCAALLVATAVVHMSSAPAVNSLMLVDLRLFGWINGSGAVSLVLLSIWWVPVFGAAGAGAAWLATHLLSLALVSLALKARGRLTADLTRSWLLASAVTLPMTGFAIGRTIWPERAMAFLGLELLALIALGTASIKAAQALGYLPLETRAAVAALRALPSRLLQSHS